MQLIEGRVMMKNLKVTRDCSSQLLKLIKTQDHWFSKCHIPGLPSFSKANQLISILDKLSIMCTKRVKTKYGKLVKKKNDLVLDEDLESPRAKSDNKFR